VTVTRFELGAMVGGGLALLLFTAGFALVGLGAEGDLAIMAFTIAAILFALLAVVGIRGTSNIRKRRRTPPAQDS
jgi:membrane protein implicated in regulation of membrane protease activity